MNRKLDSYSSRHVVTDSKPPRMSATKPYRDHDADRAFKQKPASLLSDLFVLEVANNHWGSLDRGLEIVQQFSQVVRDNHVKAAIKIQLRDVDTFIHPEHLKLGHDQRVADLTGKPRYIQKTRRTQLRQDEVRELVRVINDSGCIPLATAFDEKSVDFLEELEMPAIKLASSDLKDWGLVERCAETGKPVIVSTGGHTIDDVVEVVDFFARHNVEIAINTCVSNYPTEDSDLHLDHIDLLKRMFPEKVIGLSSHEYGDWHSSMLISYAKGARTWERHVDIPYPDGHEQAKPSPYCSLPSQVDLWFKAYHKAREMCGHVGDKGREIGQQEVDYLNALTRGAYFARDVRRGEILNRDDFFFAIPLQIEMGQLSSGATIKATWYATKDSTKNSPVTAEAVDQWSGQWPSTAAE